jgi:hypothetical protein
MIDTFKVFCSVLLALGAIAAAIYFLRPFICWSTGCEL